MNLDYIRAAAVAARAATMHETVSVREHFDEHVPALIARITELEAALADRELAELSGGQQRVARIATSDPARDNPDD